MANISLNRILFNKLESSLRFNKCLLYRPKRSSPKVFSRKSHGYSAYREVNYEPNRPYIQRFMHISAGCMWCYIFWCFRHNWRELVGEYIWPNRCEWSDQSLGIPPDDVD